MNMTLSQAASRANPGDTRFENLVTVRATGTSDGEAIIGTWPGSRSGVFWTATSNYISAIDRLVRGIEDARASPISTREQDERIGSIARTALTSGEATSISLLEAEGLLRRAVLETQPITPLRELTHPETSVLMAVAGRLERMGPMDRSTIVALALAGEGSRTYVDALVRLPVELTGITIEQQSKIAARLLNKLKPDAYEAITRSVGQHRIAVEAARILSHAASRAGHLGAIVTPSLRAVVESEPIEWADL